MSRKYKLITLISVLLFLPLALTAFVYKEYPDSWVENREDKLPIVYSDNYDITLMGIQKLHAFDSEKYGKVAKYITQELGIDKGRFFAPEKVSENDLHLIHTAAYLDSLSSSKVVARIAELGPLSLVPNFVLQQRLLDPIRYATAGTVMSARLARDYGWSINLAGGYHHAKREGGAGFGYYADIPLAIIKLWEDDPGLKILIIDLDAHQGNGNEAFFGDDERVYILDIYHEINYPGDEAAKKFIDFNWPVKSMDDQGYLAMAGKAVPEAIERSQPDIIIYNAGTDVYYGDRIGKMSLTKEGIIKRDELVFSQALENNIPILMLLSGGYSPESAGIIGESIDNLLINVIKIDK